VLCEPVLTADLIGIYSEAWLAEYLRRGKPEIGFNDLAFRLLPLFFDGSAHRCEKLIVESRQSDGGVRYSPNDIAALRTVAERAAKKLLKTGILALGQPYYYEVMATEHGALDSTGDQLGSTQIESPKIKMVPLIYRKVRISSLLSKASAVGEIGENIPIFIKNDVFQKAEQFSRKGASHQPPVESGAVVLGWLGSCPDTGEFFAVASDVIQLENTLQNKISLTYTDKTWAGIHEVLKQRQKTPANRSERIVGQCHGHNFLPCFGEKKCHQCEQQARCTATSVFVSENDLLWSRCVFSRQPWAFCQIFGLDARGIHVQQMYGFRQDRLVERGFYTIP
jgi:hypothetical protein